MGFRCPFWSILTRTKRNPSLSKRLLTPRPSKNFSSATYPLNSKVPRVPNTVASPNPLPASSGPKNPRIQRPGFRMMTDPLPATSAGSKEILKAYEESGCVLRIVVQKLLSAGHDNHNCSCVNLFL